MIVAWRGNDVKSLDAMRLRDIARSRPGGAFPDATRVPPSLRWLPLPKRLGADTVGMIGFAHDDGKRAWHAVALMAANAPKLAIPVSESRGLLADVCACSPPSATGGHWAGQSPCATWSSQVHLARSAGCQGVANVRTIPSGSLASTNICPARVATRVADVPSVEWKKRAKDRRVTCASLIDAPNSAASLRFAWR